MATVITGGVIARYGNNWFVEDSDKIRNKEVADKVRFKKLDSIIRVAMLCDLIASSASMTVAILGTTNTIKISTAANASLYFVTGIITSTWFAIPVLSCLKTANS